MTRRRGFTLLELLVAMTLTLLLTALVVQVFAFVSDGVFNSRATMDLADQLRNAKHRLIMDLRGTTAPTIPPLEPSAEQGYFEYVEGPRVANFPGGDIGRPSLIAAGKTDTYFGDLDDVMMFTTVNFDEEMAGKAANGVAKTRYAEVAWFLKPVTNSLGRVSGTHGTVPYFTLNRRVWLVSPNANLGSSFGSADQSLRQDLGRFELMQGNNIVNFSDPVAATLNPVAVRNSLGDLTMRERRPIHQNNLWPYDIYYCLPDLTTANHYTVHSVANNGAFWQAGNPYLTLPSLHEQSMGSFPDPVAEAYTEKFPPLNQKWKIQLKDGKYIDSSGPILMNNVPVTSISNGGREQSDIILTNVVGFDIKAWDPGAPVFRAKPSTVSDATPNVVGLIAPGDAGYGGDGTGGNPTGALQGFINSSGGGDYAPVSFGAYADLNYMWINCAGPARNMDRRSKYLNALHNYERSLSVGSGALPLPAFGFGHPRSALSGYSPINYQFPAVYDTWSRHYEYDGISNDDDNFDGTIDIPGEEGARGDLVDEGTDGVDNNGNGFIDEPAIDLDGDGIISDAEDALGETDSYAPFPAPLRGLKITIRVMEQDSRQVREVTIIHEFLPL